MYPLGLMLEIISIQEVIFMTRTRKLSPERKVFINSLIEHYHPENAHDVQEMLKGVSAYRLSRR